MDVILNIAKSILYSIAISIGLIIPNTTSTTVPFLNNNVASDINISEVVSKVDNTINQINTKKIDLVKSTTTKIAKSEKTESPPVVITKKISQLDIQNSKPLIASQIFILTNKERAKLSLPLLVWNQKLAQGAEMKNLDMIKKKYFAHESPDGKGIDYLASSTRYKYSLIGENLAMGDFLSNEEVVTSWMNSPGHKANILKPTFKEIGISTVIGENNGRYVWYATQEFGRPAPSCTPPDVNLESLITNTNSYSKTLKSELLRIKTNIEKGNFSNADIKSLIEQYNFLVNKGNNLQSKVKELVDVYNKSAQVYNACVEKENYEISASK